MLLVVVYKTILLANASLDLEGHSYLV